jgi:hypothetical protein
VAPPDRDKDDDTFSFTGPSLGPDGKLESPSPAAEGVGRIERVAPLRPPARAPKSEPLDLVERPPRPDTDYVAPPPPPPAKVPSRSVGVWPVLLILAAAGAGGFYLRERSRAQKRPTPAAVVLITSEPTRSTVRIEGTEVGTTPWAADNTWGPGLVKVEVSHPGYRTWTGSFGGGAQARLDAHLQRR